MRTIHAQLHANQLWETASFAAKAGFLFLLTPVMLRHWGVAGYGEFAIASSAMIFVSMFDLGLRGRTRIELCQAVAAGEQDGAHRLMARAVARFLLSASVIFGGIWAVARAGVWSRLLDLPPAMDGLIVVTALCTQLQMLTGLFLEPLIAEGRIGLTKLLAALGAMVAIPTVWLTLHLGGSVTRVIEVWLGCSIAANLLALIVSGHWRRMVEWDWRAAYKKGDDHLFSGIWFNIANAAWMAKNHGLTFLVSALSGPASVGAFFIILRLSEIVGCFGTIASDVSLGGMSTRDQNARRVAFSSGYHYATTICLTLALGIGLFTPAFWQYWLKTAAPLGWWTGWLAALLGLASGLNRMIVYAAMSLRIIRMATVWALLEGVLALGGAGWLQGRVGLEGTLIVAALSVLALSPVAVKISEELEQPFWRTWLPGLTGPELRRCLPRFAGAKRKGV